MLPSQNVAAVVSSLLPRNAWAPFLERFKRKDASAESVKTAICQYSALHGVALRGQLVNGRSQPAQPPLQLEDHPPTPPDEPSVPTTNPEETTDERPTRQSLGNLPAKNLAKLLAPELKGRVPAYHLKKPDVFALAFIRELDKAVSAVPCPTRHSHLDDLASVLGRLDEKRMKLLERAAWRLVIGRSIDGATSKAGAKKKIRSDTACPEPKEEHQIISPSPEGVEGDLGSTFGAGS